MADITWTDVVALASELATVPVLAQDMILAHVNTTLAVAVFGGEESPKLKFVRVLLAAHMATMLTGGGESGAAGPLTSETIGTNSLSRSYAATDVSNSDLALTGYGRQYQQIVRTSGGRFPRVP